jgi:MFS family permease
LRSGTRVTGVDEKVAKASGLILLTLASAQFLMTLDSSVMNVSIATVAKDVGTTVTGIQSAITLYTLVMASLMITGGKVGQIIGRKRAFAIGCVIYGAGSFTTALSQSLAMLIFGWSLLEGIGAALIMPAIVALVASNFGRSERPRAYGLVASAGAIAVAAGPLIGGLFTTYASWRWVAASKTHPRNRRSSISSARDCRRRGLDCLCTGSCAPAPGDLSFRSRTHRSFSDSRSRSG